MSEISKCPFPNCGKPTRLIKDKLKNWVSVHCDLCEYRGPLASTGINAIAAHNDLCKLVEKGRDYDRLASTYRVCCVDLSKAESQRDEAVGLLRQHEYERNRRSYPMSEIKPTNKDGTTPYACDHATFCSLQCYERWHNENIPGKPDCGGGEADDKDEAIGWRCEQCGGIVT